MWGLWWTKRHWGRFSPTTSISPANHHSTNFSIIVINKGWHNKPIGSRSVGWTQLDSTPHYTNLKNIRTGRPRDRSWSPGRVKYFLFSTSSRPALGPTQLPVQWVPWALSTGVKRLGRETDHSPPASAEVKKMWICTFIPPYAFMAQCLISQAQRQLYLYWKAAGRIIRWIMAVVCGCL
jgi:hypothetical protein